MGRIVGKVNSKATVSSRSVLSDTQKYMVKQTVWSLTCGRSWLTGEDVAFDKAGPHHILHDPITGMTLYGASYEGSFENYAILTHKQNTVDVERLDKREDYQALFIYMWQKFKEGDFDAATAHWDDIFRVPFLRDLKSKKYPDYWLSFL